MLRAIIFDFNGVVVNDEPVHLKLFQKVLAEEGITLEDQDYYRRYLGMDDRDCFAAVFRHMGRKLDDSQLADLIQRKADYYRQWMKEEIAVFPGVARIIPELSRHFPLAIASGALKHEVEMILTRVGIRAAFQVIVSAEDVTCGKPDPEIFLTALRWLNRRTERPIQASECLVVEDSKEGILGAHAAGFKCLAITNSYPAAELTEADAVIRSLEEVTIPFLEKLLD